MSKQATIWLVIIILAVILGVGGGFLITRKFNQPVANQNQNANTNNIIQELKGNEEQVKDFLTKYFNKIKESPGEGVYWAFNNALSDEGWQDFIAQCETIEANKNKGYVRLLQEGRLQKLWEQCAYSDKFNFEIKEIKRLDNAKFESKVLITDLNGKVYGVDKHPDWADGRPIVVEYKIWGEYKTDEWNFFRL